MRDTATVVERFMAKVIKSPDGCWLWSASKNPKGYGWFTLDGKVLFAHRASLLLLRDIALRQGDLVCHHCDVPSCVNPDHLYVGTAASNTADMIRRGRHAPPRGLANGRAKLADVDVARIRARAQSGESKKSIARDLHLHPSYVGRLVRGVRR